MALPIGFTPLPVTITSGTSLSAEVGLGAKTLVGIGMPAGWDAASITFEVSIDGGLTWLNLFDATGAEIAAVAAAGEFIALDPSLFAAVNDIKVRSGTAGVPVVQTSDRALTLMTRPL